MCLGEKRTGKTGLTRGRYLHILSFVFSNHGIYFCWVSILEVNKTSLFFGIALVFALVFLPRFTLQSSCPHPEVGVRLILTGI